MFPGVFEECFPIGAVHLVFAGAFPVTKTASGKLIQRRLGPGRQSFHTQQLVDRVSSLKHIELTIGIGPLVLQGIAKQHGAGRDQRRQGMLVKRQGRHTLIELLEPAIEPMGKGCIDTLDRFAHCTSRRGCAAAAGLVRNDQSKALIQGSRQISRFAEP